MADLIVVASIAAFFVVCVLYVSGCDRIVGPDPEPPLVDDGERATATPGVRS